MFDWTLALQTEVVNGVVNFALCRGVKKKKKEQKDVHTCVCYVF